MGSLRRVVLGEHQKACPPERCGGLKGDFAGREGVTCYDPPFSRAGDHLGPEGVERKGDGVEGRKEGRKRDWCIIRRL